jgi:polyisoprenoid-binding protein YceI
MTTTAGPGVLTYQLDAMHSSAHFSVRHMMISRVRGQFSKLTGTLQLDPANHEFSKVNAEIDVKSIDTNQSQRDDHLRTGDFFEADTYPTITFTSTNIEKTGGESAKVTGDLTIRGVTKEVTLDVEGSPIEVNDLYGNLRIGISATAKIKRSDFGLTYNMALEAGGVVIGDDVSIEIDAQFVRPAA